MDVGEPGRAGFVGRAPCRYSVKGAALTGTCCYQNFVRPDYQAYRPCWWGEARVVRARGPGAGGRIGRPRTVLEQLPLGIPRPMSLAVTGSRVSGRDHGFAAPDGGGRPARSGAAWAYGTEPIAFRPRGVGPPGGVVWPGRRSFPGMAAGAGGVRHPAAGPGGGGRPEVAGAPGRGVGGLRAVGGGRCGGGRSAPSGDDGVARSRGHAGFRAVPGSSQRVCRS